MKICRLAGLAACLICVSACVTVRPRTEAVVEIEAEREIAALDPAISIRISGGPSEDALAVVHEQDLAHLSDDEDGRLRITVLPENDDASRVFTVEVYAFETGGRVVGRVVARGRFLAGRTTFLTLTLEDCCRAIAGSCARHETCDGCACVPTVVIDPSQDAGPPPGVDAFSTDDAGPEPDTGAPPPDAPAPSDTGSGECSTPFDCPARACQSAMCNRTECVYTPLCAADQACCDGVCAANCDCVGRGSGEVCRGASGECDRAELCDGMTASCPPDVFAPATTACAGGSCNGLGTCSVGCSAGAPCAVPGEPCALGQIACPSGACVASGPAPAGTACRPASDACDLPESCDGSSARCPDDARRPVGTTCRASAGPCDVEESCDGSVSCPPDRFRPSGEACGMALGECESAPSCTGTSAACSPGPSLEGMPCSVCNGVCTSGFCLPRCTPPLSLCCEPTGACLSSRDFPDFCGGMM